MLGKKLFSLLNLTYLKKSLVTLYLVLTYDVIFGPKSRLFGQMRRKRPMCTQKDVFLGQKWQHSKKLDMWPKKCFNRLNLVNGTIFSYTVLAKKSFKTVKTGHFCHIWPKIRLFGPNMTSSVQIRHDMTKTNFSKDSTH